MLSQFTDWHEGRRVVVTAVDSGSDNVDMSFDNHSSKPIVRHDLVAPIDRFVPFDRYEGLLSAYNAVPQKDATSEGSISESACSDDRIVDFQRRRGRLREKLRRSVASFDGDLVEIVRDTHEFQS